MSEEWKQIPGFGGHYEASTLGRVRVKDRVVTKRHRMGALIEQFYPSHLLKSYCGDKWGHQYVTIGVDNKALKIGVHRMVLLAFVGEPPSGCEGCHNNGDPSDNRPENLRWDTHFNNNQDRKNAGHYASGKNHPMAKLTPDQVIAIRTRAVTKKEAMWKYGISNSQHHRIMKGESWSHLGDAG